MDWTQLAVDISYLNIPYKIVTIRTNMIPRAIGRPKKEIKEIKCKKYGCNARVSSDIGYCCKEHAPCSKWGKDKGWHYGKSFTPEHVKTEKGLDLARFGWSASPYQSDIPLEPDGKMRRTSKLLRKK